MLASKIANRPVLAKEDNVVGNWSLVVVIIVNNQQRQHQTTHDGDGDVDEDDDIVYL